MVVLSPLYIGLIALLLTVTTITAVVVVAKNRTSNITPTPTINCDVNDYRYIDEDNNCVSCKNNQYVSDDSCVDCPSSHIYNRDTKKCEECDDSSYYDSVSLSCLSYCTANEECSSGNECESGYEKVSDDEGSVLVCCDVQNGYTRVKKEDGTYSCAKALCPTGVDCVGAGYSTDCSDSSSIYSSGACCPAGQDWTGVECCDKIYNGNMCCKDDGDVAHDVADGGTVCWPSSQIDKYGNSCPVDVDEYGNCPETFACGTEENCQTNCGYANEDSEVAETCCDTLKCGQYCDYNEEEYNCVGDKLCLKENTYMNNDSLACCTEEGYSVSDYDEDGNATKCCATNLIVDGKCCDADGSAVINGSVCCDTPNESKTECCVEGPDKYGYCCGGDYTLGNFGGENVCMNTCPDSEGLSCPSLRDEDGNVINYSCMSKTFGQELTSENKEYLYDKLCAASPEKCICSGEYVSDLSSFKTNCFPNGDDKIEMCINGAYSECVKKNDGVFVPSMLGGYYPYSTEIEGTTCDGGDVTSQDVSVLCREAADGNLSWQNGNRVKQVEYEVDKDGYSCPEIGGFVACYADMITAGDDDNTSVINYDSDTKLCTKIASYSETGTNGEEFPSTDYTRWADGSITENECSDDSTCDNTPEGQWCYDIERGGAENIDNSRCLEDKEILGIHRQGETSVDTCENGILIDDSSFCPGGDNYTEPSTCEVNSYRYLTEDDDCIVCKENQYVDNNSCVNCGDEQVYNRDTENCESCGENQYYNSSTITCLDYCLSGEVCTSGNDCEDGSTKITGQDADGNDVIMCCPSGYTRVKLENGEYSCEKPLCPTGSLECGEGDDKLNGTECEESDSSFVMNEAGTSGSCCSSEEGWTGAKCCATDRIFNNGTECCEDEDGIEYGLADGETVCWPSSKIDDDGNSCPIDVLYTPQGVKYCPDNFSCGESPNCTTFCGYADENATTQNTCCDTSTPECGQYCTYNAEDYDCISGKICEKGNVYTSDGVSACCDSEDYIVSDYDEDGNATKCCEVQYYNQIDRTCCEPPKELLSEEGLCCDEGKSGKTNINSETNDKCCDVGPDGDGICCPDTTDSTVYSLQVIDGKSTCVRDCNGTTKCPDKYACITKTFENTLSETEKLGLYEALCGASSESCIADGQYITDGGVFIDKCFPEGSDTLTVCVTSDYNECSAVDESYYVPSAISNYLPHTNTISLDNATCVDSSGNTVDITTNNIQDVCQENADNNLYWNTGFRAVQTTLSNCDNDVGGLLACYDKLATNSDEGSSVYFDKNTGLCTKITSYDADSDRDFPEDDYIKWSDGTITEKECGSTCKNTPVGQYCYSIERGGEENIDNSRCIEAKELEGIAQEGQDEADIDTCSDGILITDVNYCPDGDAFTEPSTCEVNNYRYLVEGDDGYTDANCVTCGTTEYAFNNECVSCGENQVYDRDYTGDDPSLGCKECGIDEYYENGYCKTYCISGEVCSTSNNCEDGSTSITGEGVNMCCPDGFTRVKLENGEYSCAKPLCPSDVDCSVTNDDGENVYSTECEDDTAVYSSETGYCCPSGEYWTGSACCPVGQETTEGGCCDTDKVYTNTDGNNACCDSDGSLGSLVIDGECCPSNRIYQDGDGNNACCTFDVDGEECPEEVACGSELCLTTEDEPRSCGKAYYDFGNADHDESDECCATAQLTAGYCGYNESNYTLVNDEFCSNDSLYYGGTLAEPITYCCDTDGYEVTDGSTKCCETNLIVDGECCDTTGSVVIGGECCDKPNGDNSECCTIGPDDYGECCYNDEVLQTITQSDGITTKNTCVGTCGNDTKCPASHTCITQTFGEDLSDSNKLGIYNELCSDSESCICQGTYITTGIEFRDKCFPGGDDVLEVCVATAQYDECSAVDEPKNIPSKVPDEYRTYTDKIFQDTDGNYKCVVDEEGNTVNIFENDVFDNCFDMSNENLYWDTDSSEVYRVLQVELANCDNEIGGLLACYNKLATQSDTDATINYDHSTKLCTKLIKADGVEDDTLDDDYIKWSDGTLTKKQCGNSCATSPDGQWCDTGGVNDRCIEATELGLYNDSGGIPRQGYDSADTCSDGTLINSAVLCYTGAFIGDSPCDDTNFRFTNSDGNCEVCANNEYALNGECVSCGDDEDGNPQIYDRTWSDDDNVSGGCTPCGENQYYEDGYCLEYCLTDSVCENNAQPCKDGQETKAHGEGVYMCCPYEDDRVVKTTVDGEDVYTCERKLCPDGVNCLETNEDGELVYSQVCETSGSEYSSDTGYCCPSGEYWSNETECCPNEQGSTDDGCCDEARIYVDGSYTKCCLDSSVNTYSVTGDGTCCSDDRIYNDGNSCCNFDLIDGECPTEDICENGDSCFTLRSEECAKTSYDGDNSIETEKCCNSSEVVNGYCDYNSDSYTPIGSDFCANVDVYYDDDNQARCCDAGGYSVSTDGKCCADELIADNGVCCDTEGYVTNGECCANPNQDNTECCSVGPDKTGECCSSDNYILQQMSDDGDQEETCVEACGSSPTAYCPDGYTCLTNTFANSLEMTDKTTIISEICGNIANSCVCGTTYITNFSDETQVGACFDDSGETSTLSMCVNESTANACSASVETSYAPDDIDLSSLGSLDYYPYSQNITNDNGVWKCNSGNDVTTTSISTSCPTSGLSLTNGQSSGYRISQATLSCNNEIGGYLLCYDKMKTDGTLDNTDEIIYDHATGLCTKISSYDYTGTNHQILQDTVDDEDAPYVLWSDGSITTPTCSDSGYNSCNITILSGGNWCQVGPGFGYCLEDSDVNGMARSNGSYNQCNGQNEILVQNSSTTGPCPDDDNICDNAQNTTNNNTAVMKSTGCADADSSNIMYAENRTPYQIKVEYLRHDSAGNSNNTSSLSNYRDESSWSSAWSFISIGGQDNNDYWMQAKDNSGNRTGDSRLYIRKTDETTLYFTSISNPGERSTKVNFRQTDEKVKTGDVIKQFENTDVSQPGNRFALCTLEDEDGNQVDNYDYYVAIINEHIVIGRVSQLTLDEFQDFGVASLYRELYTTAGTWTGNGTNQTANEIKNRFPGLTYDQQEELFNILVSADDWGNSSYSSD